MTRKNRPNTSNPAKAETSSAGPAARSAGLGSHGDIHLGGVPRGDIRLGDIHLGIPSTPPDAKPILVDLPEPPPSAEPAEPEAPVRAGKRSFGPRPMLFAGVAGACVLGAALGLWARPNLNERSAVAAITPWREALPVDPNARRLQIVVDDQPPAPVGEPIEVLPASGRLPTRTSPLPFTASAPAAAMAPATVQKAATPPHQAFELPKLNLAPMVVAALADARSLGARLQQPVTPLVRLPQPTAAPVQPVELAQAPAPKARPAAEIKLAEAAAAILAAEKAAEARHDARIAAAKAAAQAQAHQVQLARAAEAQKARVATAKVQQAQFQLLKAKAAQAQKAQLQQVKLQKAQADHAARLQLAKVQKAETLKLAKAEAKGRAEALAEAREEAREEARKQVRLASLAHAVRQMLPHPKAAPVEVARLDRKHARKPAQEAVVERASLKTHRPAHAAPPPSRHAVAVTPQPRPEGLMKVSAPRCANRDPGEAIVCADPNLGAADRQLSRAYQGARAAGVPADQLQRQQQRWLAARSAAAREAPWAVRDVYLARIAELNSQARDAHGDGYQ